MKYLLTALMSIMAIGMLTVSSPVMAQDACEGQIGAGYGLCVSAHHLGCGTDLEKNTNACTKIEDNFVTITGELPPWLKAPLLCWFPSDQQRHLCADYSVDDCPTGCKVYGFNPTDRQNGVPATTNDFMT